MLKRRRNAAVATFILILLLMLVLPGCGFVKGLLSDGQEMDQGQPTVETEADLAPEDVGTVLPPENASVSDPFEITLYFADAAGSKLVPEVRTIEKVEGIARATINELILGPTSGDLLPTLPQGTALLDINVKETGLCIVDFSQEIVQENAEGVIPPELTVYSVVNTLTQFPTVDRVQFRIEGQNVETLGGGIPAIAPITPSTELVEN